MSILLVVCLMTLFLAYTNGGNDNFKGVATLYSGNIMSYRGALGLATVATFAGGISSILLASALIKVFSGSGVVPSDLAASPIFLGSVATGAASTVAIATLLGLPISTTHGLTGAIIGAGFVADPAQLNIGVLGSAFFAPLLISPVLAVVLTVLSYPLLHAVRMWLGIGRETCICVGTARFRAVRQLQLTPGHASYAMAWTADSSSPIVVSSSDDCVEKYGGRILGVPMQALTDVTHKVSAAAVSYARGLNDTPKIVALLLAMEALDIRLGAVAIATAMAIGGLIHARKVAHTMSKKISRMNDGQALTANLITALLVISASRFGLPVSTTHVSVGAITGIGLTNGSADKRIIYAILTSWFLTLPIAALIGALAYTALPQFTNFN